MMAGPEWCVFLVFGLSLSLAMPNNVIEEGVPLSVDMPQGRQDLPAEDFSGGFSQDFAVDLPTNEFLGNFNGRQKRQVGISTAIDGILKSPYGSELANPHLQALLNRNTFRRPARQSRPSVQQPLQSFPNLPSSLPTQQTFSNQQNQPSRSQSSFSNEQSFSAPQNPTRIRQSFRPALQHNFNRAQDTEFRSTIRQQSARPAFQQNFNARETEFHPSVRQTSQPTRLPFSRNDPFSSSSFTGQQFRTPFPNIQNSFSSFRSQRTKRQKRQVPQTQDVSSQISQILNTPYQGSIPSSLSSLFNRNNRFPRKSQQNSRPRKENQNTVNQQPQSVSVNPFATPFEIPNFFRGIGIRKRSLNFAQRRQGISDALDDIIYSPYEGSVPSSIQSLLDFNKNRFVRKTPPSPRPSQQNQQFPNIRPQPTFQQSQQIRRPNLSQTTSQLGFRQSNPIVSNDPSTASVRLVPKTDDAGSGFKVNLDSGHIFFRRHHGRKKRSVSTRQQIRPRRFVKNKPFRQNRNRHRMNLHPSNRLRPLPSRRPRQRARPEFTHDDDFQDLSDAHKHQIFEIDSAFSPIEGFQSLDFLSNFETPLGSSYDQEIHDDQADAIIAIQEVRDKFVPHPVNQHPIRKSPRSPIRGGRPRQPRIISPGLRPGPSPPAFILPAKNTVRAPRHIIMENRILPKATRQQDIPIIRRSMSVAETTHSGEGVLFENPEAQEASSGFIVGRPNNFPSFVNIGGFEPMSAQDKGDEEASFVPPFHSLQMNIPDIPENNQPEFQLPEFAQQKQGFNILNENASDQKRGFTKRSKPKLRMRRRAGEPDPNADPSTIPHKRVHRVQIDDQVPHIRNPREFQEIPDSQVAFSELPFQVDPFPEFQFPVFQSERIPASGNPRMGFNASPRSRENINRKVQIRTPDDDFIVPESQRFYPNFNPRSPPTPPIHSSQPFFPSSPSASRTSGPRGNRYNGHGPGVRESSSIRNSRNNGGFRDFHDTFYGPREGSNKPDFSFPNSKRPTHREIEPLDNTLLGSGNFEVIRGGTFYDDDLDIHSGYDHLLHDGYYGSHPPHNGPHSNNHVDDFFSNFRDFSEFAARRSDEGETSLDDGSYYSHGFASEQIPQVIDNSHPDFADAIKNIENKDEELDKEYNDNNKKASLKSDTVQPKYTKTKLIFKSGDKHTNSSKKHRQPKNIQEVLEDLESESKEDYDLSPQRDEENDPMIAMF